MPAHGRGGFQGTHNIALRVFFHLLIAGHTVQLLLVIVFQAHFADMGGTAIEFVAVFAFQLVAVFVADAADIADNMGGEPAVGVFAEGAGVHFHAFKPEQHRRQPCRFFGAQFQFQRNALVGSGFGTEALETLHIGLANFHIRAQGRYQILHFHFQFVGNDFQRIGRIIVRQHHAVHIGDFAANRRGGDKRDAVGGGFIHKFLVPGYLKPHKLPHQHTEKHQNHDKRHHQPQQVILLSATGRRFNRPVMMTRLHLRERR